MNIWLTLLAAGAITYGTRLSFILLFGRMEIPEWLKRTLRFVPAAVLTAIVFPELLLQDGALNVSLGNGRLLAGALAVLVAWRTKNVLLTILVGMAVLLILQAMYP
jgi:branched-subunit amino acid transport protein